MTSFPSLRAARAALISGIAATALTGCMGAGTTAPQLPSANFVANQEGPGEEYIIGPLDELQIFVWRNPELGGKVQVRPDGRITTPLITDMPAVGKTPTMLQPSRAAPSQIRIGYLLMIAFGMGKVLVRIFGNVVIICRRFGWCKISNW